MSERNKGKHDTASVEREVLIQERTVLFEESGSLAAQPNASDDASGAVMTREDYRALEYAATANEARPQPAHHRHRGDLSEAQFRLLENLERLTHSLQGPEDSLDRHGYSRPFPPNARPVPTATKPTRS